MNCIVSFPVTSLGLVLHTANIRRVSIADLEVLRFCILHVRQSLCTDTTPRTFFTAATIRLN